MPPEKIISAVLQRGIFTDILEVAFCFGIERIKKHVDPVKLGSNDEAIRRMIANIEIGFTTAKR